MPRTIHRRSVQEYDSDNFAPRKLHAPRMKVHDENSCLKFMYAYKDMGKGDAHSTSGAKKLFNKMTDYYPFATNHVIVATRCSQDGQSNSA